jgi:flagellar hook-associated protein 3 FlgL
MINSNTKTNINANKVLVDKYNTQMTTQKKINKPSENPVIAIRSLRMQTTLSHVDQFLNNNIADASAWLEVTDTALTNMKTLLESIRTQCVNGSTDTLKDEDRQTILQELQQMADQVYSEGNADYAGRTIFTGYRTTSQLTFQEDEENTTYQIDQNFDYEDLEEHRVYYGTSEVPVDAASESVQTVDSIGTQTYDRLRLAYDNAQSLDGVTYTYKADSAPQGAVEMTEEDYEEALKNGTVDSDSVIYVQDTGEVHVKMKVMSADDVKQTAAADMPENLITTYATEADWEADNPTKELGDYDVIYIESTGELLFGSKIANEMKSSKADVSLSYTKTGFEEGEARPEYYYDCRDISDAANIITYEKGVQEINYEISSGIMLAANTEASDVFDTSIRRDVYELIDIVSAAINAHDKVDKISTMMLNEQYADETSQANLQSYLDVAEKEAAYADDNLQKTYSQYITNFDNYLEQVNIAHTNIGSKENRLSLTKTRVENQKETVEELKTNNDNRELSDVIIDYYAAYNAYTASLTAAAKVNQQTLLNYL